MVKLDKTGPGHTGREYLRVSTDRSGRLRSPEEQHDENLPAAERQGIVLGEPYAEPKAVSASVYATKARQVFGRLMDDLRSGAFGAEVLVLWESSRGSRTVAEWSALIDACRDAGVQIMITTHGRVYDPAHGRDRRSLHEDASDSEYESWKTSQRVKRDLAAKAAEGRPHGHVPFGYRRVYDDTNRRLIAQEIYEPEAAIVRELFARLHKGHALHAIARDFAERGIVNRQGKPFSPPHLRDMALRAAYAGYRVHDTSGRSHGRWQPDAVRTAWWKPLVSPKVFHEVREMLTASERSKGRPGRATYLLSMIAVCDPCGSWLIPKTLNGRMVYQCQRGHVSIGMDDLDEYVEAEILTYLSRDDVYQAWAVEGDGEELARVRAELAAVNAELAAADPEKVKPKDVHETLAFAALRRSLTERRDSLEARVRELTVPAVLRELAGPEARARWKVAPIAAKRGAARLLLASDPETDRPAKLGQVRVTRWPEGVWYRTPVPAADRVVWRLRSAPDGEVQDDEVEGEAEPSP